MWYWKSKLVYKSKHKSKRENQVILWIVPDDKKWHYLPVKGLSALLRGITSNQIKTFIVEIPFTRIVQKIPQKTWKCMQWLWLLLCRNA